MKFVVIGATGNLGREVVEKALKAGHDVVAYVRRPEALDEKPGLNVMGGGLDDLQLMSAAFTGADVVISCAGANTGSFAQETLPTITEAIAQAGVDRFVLVSAFGVGDTKEKASPIARIIYKSLVKKLFGDKELAERAILPTLELDWTVAYPVNLKKGEAAGDAATQRFDEVGAVPGLPTLTFAGAAEALVKVAERDDLSRQRVLITTANGWRAA